MQVLIVDDDQTTLRLLERNLQRWEYPVHTATNGFEALSILVENPQINLLVTDLVMPGMDGLELTRRARAVERSIYLHIIMLSVRDEKRDLLAGMDAGADAFLSKPFNVHEFHAHVKVAKRISQLEVKLDNKIEELETARETLQKEIDAAGKIQRTLLPSVSPKVKGISTAWCFESCGATAGDMLNVVRLDEHHLGMYVLDVSGHGCQAALLSVSLSRVLNPYPQQGGILKRFTTGTRGYQIPSPAEVAADLNRRFPVMRQSGQFFTFIYGILNIHSLEFSYTRAGHPEPIFIRDGKTQPNTGTSALPIGISDDVTYQDTSVTLQPGDTMLFFTDGFEEALNQNREELGRQRMIEALKNQNGDHCSAEDAIETLKTLVATHTEGRQQLDDMTMVGLSLHPSLVPA